MNRLVAQMKALGDENRFRIMMMLRERPLCSCEMLEILDIAGGTLSAHLKVLKESGLIDQEKKGRWIQCSINRKDAADLVEYLAGRISSSSVFNTDAKAIRMRPPAAESSCTLST